MSIMRNLISMIGNIVCCWQGRSMPLLPKHAASFRGNQRRYDIQTQKTSHQRIRVLAHSNMYIGQLRAKIGAHVGSLTARLATLNMYVCLLLILSKSCAHWRYSDEIQLDSKSSQQLLGQATEIKATLEAQTDTLSNNSSWMRHLASLLQK